jgi:heme/copper-type cytochrome/quinol oxidase subunit 1
MTTIDTHGGESTQDPLSAFVVASGHWVTSSDHKKIGRLFIGVSLLTAVTTALLGVLIGIERMSPAAADILPADALLQIVSLYKFDLVLGLLAPLFLGIAIAVVPMQVGSRAIAFPRLAQTSFWTWLFGTVMVLVAIIGNGGPGGGATDLVDLYLLGVALTAVGLLAASVCVATTVLTSRAPGMTLDLVPAFSWASLVASVATLLSLPVAIGTVVYLYIDHTYGKLVFGGKKSIDTWLGYSFATPQTFVFIVMALGVLAEIAPVTARVRQPLRPIVLVGLALISTAALGAVTQSTHTFNTSGAASDVVKSAIPFLLFNGLPVLGVLVTIALSLLAFKEGKLRVTAPFAFALLGSLMILVGAAGNLVGHAEAAALGNTSFAEGVTLYLVYGGVLVALGAIAHWAPKLWGRVLEDKKALPLAALGLLGTIASSFPLFIAGFANQPADLANGFDYDGPIALWNVLSAGGHALMLLTVLAFVGLLLSSVVSGSQAADDPFDAHTLEWAIPSPAPVDNFASLANVGSSEPLLDVKPAQEVSA